MSQSPLARSARRKTLPVFSHTPSRLSHSTSLHDLAGAEDEEPTTPTEQKESRRRSTNNTPTRTETPKYKSTATTTNSPHTPTFSSAHAGPHTPTTPKILYSPYATSTPPGALSKSTSIPFDMAASLKAGREAEEHRQSSVEPSSSKKKRFVRKKTIFQRAQEFPQKVYDVVVLHYPLSIEDVLPPPHTANPISLGIHAIHWLLLAPLLRSSSEPDSVLRSTPAKTGVGSRWDKYEDSGSASRGIGGAWFTFLVTLILFLLASANSVYLFTKFRRYDMQLRSAQDPVDSPHASPVSSPQRKESEGEKKTEEKKEQTREQKILGWTLWAVVGLSKWLYATTLAIFGHQASHERSFDTQADQIQSLRVWEPPEFCLAFFCAYPPSAPLLSYLLTPLHPLLTPLLHLVTSFLLSHLAASYAQLVKDRLVLSAEVMKEYDRRFVYKRIFASRVDRGTQTEQAESLWA